MKNISLLSLCFLVTTTLATNKDCNTFFLKIGTGGSFSRCADICASERDWSFSPNGFNSDLGKSEFYTVGLGYKHSPLFRAALEVTYRPEFHYCKFQLTPTLPVALGNRTRVFDFSNLSIMASGYFYGQGMCHDWLVYEMCNNTIIQPFVGFGVGVSYNTVSNFHAVLTDRIRVGSTTQHHVASAMEPHTERALAWHATLGVELLHCDWVSFDLGYRYFHGGKFETNNWIYAAYNPSDPTHANTISPWHGTLKAHEFFINLSFFKEF